MDEIQPMDVDSKINAPATNQITVQFGDDVNCDDNKYDDDDDVIIQMDNVPAGAHGQEKLKSKVK